MTHRLKTLDSVNVIHFPDRFDASQMIRMKSRLSRLLNRHPKMLLLDLTETREIKLAGLGMLIERLGRASNGTGVRFTNASPVVCRTLARAGVDGLIAS